eukprot:scaffold116748_cov15-Tisochrysis_lutea.AAC.2
MEGTPEIEGGSGFRCLGGKRTASCPGACVHPCQPAHMYVWLIRRRMCGGHTGAFVTCLEAHAHQLDEHDCAGSKEPSLLLVPRALCA